MTNEYQITYKNRLTGDQVIVTAFGKDLEDCKRQLRLKGMERCNEYVSHQLMPHMGYYIVIGIIIMGVMGWMLYTLASFFVP